MRGWSRSSVSKVFSSTKMWWFFGKNFLHQVWLNILKDECSLKFVFKFCSWVFLKWTLAERRPVTASGGTTFQGCGWQWVLHDCLLVCVSGAVIYWFGFLFSFFFFFSHCATFFFFPPFYLHADKFLCFTSPKTPSSSWMSHLSELCICLFSSWPWFSLLASCLRARHTLCFLLYRSSSFQCQINTV